MNWWFDPSLPFSLKNSISNPEKQALYKKKMPGIQTQTETHTLDPHVNAIPA